MVTSPKRRVLLIDDSEISLAFAETQLTTEGYDVRTALDLEQFDETLGDWEPDIILTDVNRPGIAGPELCRRLKARYETAHVPVVLFSSLSDEELAKLARECGADGFVSKVSAQERLAEELELLCQTMLW
jgi:CheY-like chemotaxis protein